MLSKNVDNMFSVKSTILYIDDDKLSLEIFKEFFQTYYHVITLESSLKADEVLSENPVKVIVSDQMMPDETGIEFFKRIGPKYPDIIKIILTAYSSKDNALQAINDAAIFKYLLKPWRKDITREVVENAIREYDLKAENKQLLIELKEKNTAVIKAYKESEANEIKFRTIFANSNDSSYIISPEKKIIEANHSFLKLTGYNADPANMNELTFYVSHHFPFLIDRPLELKDSTSKHDTDIEIESHKGEKRTFEISSNQISYNDKTVILVVLHDISERRIYEKKIVEAIIETQEEDQSKYARELHDGLGPLLSTLKMHVQWLANESNTNNKEKIINHALHSVDSAIRSVKDIANNLSPHILQRFGLVYAINAYIEHINETCTIDFAVSSNIKNRLRPNTETILYRILLECINNSLKHSEAKKIIISFKKQFRSLEIGYFDNGKGFDVKKEMQEGHGMGLFNIQNRIRHLGGQFKINSKFGVGTELKFVVDLTD